MGYRFIGRLPIALALVLITALVFPSFSSSDPLNGTTGDDVLVCTGDCDGISGLAGDDTITQAGNADIEDNHARAAEQVVELAGPGRADVSVGVAADAAAVDAGPGDDVLITAADSRTTAQAEADADVTLIDIDLTAGAGADAQSTADASATGINVGPGNDETTSMGTVEVTARSEAGGAAAETPGLVDALGMPVSFADGVPTIDMRARSAAEAAGIGAVGGRHVLIHTGSTDVAASAAVDDINVRHNHIDAGVIDARQFAEASALGIAGSDITQTGSVTAASLSEILSLDLEFNMVDAAYGSGSATASATTTAVGGTVFGDRVVNGGTVWALAESDIGQYSGNLSLVDVTVFQGGYDFIAELFSDLLGEAAVSADTTAEASVWGIAVGAGRDHVTNTAAVTALADADFEGVTVGIGAEGVPASLFDAMAGRSLADAGPTADAESIGIDGGADADTIENLSVVTARATADGNAYGFSLSLPLLEKVVTGPSPAFALGGAGTTAKTGAWGVRGGEAADQLTNAGIIDVDASADAAAVQGSLALQGVVDDIDTIDLQASIADTATLGEASAFGLSGDGGNDTLTNTGALFSDADADVDGVSVSLGIQGKIDKAMNFGAALARSDVTAKAQSRGMAGGTGSDRAANAGTVQANAIADALGVATSVEYQGYVKDSVSLGGAIADISIAAEADAAGMAGGQGRDDLDNNSEILAEATASALDAAVAVTAAGTEDGISAGLALAKGDAASTALAAGIDGGNDEDDIDNAGRLTADAHAEVRSQSITVDIKGTGKGAGTGAALTSTRSEAEAQSRGLSGGGHNDGLTNRGSVSARAGADARSLAVAVGLQGTDKGLAAGVTLADSDTRAGAASVGMDGGDGADVVDNQSAVGSTALARSRSTQVLVEVAGSMQGAALGAALSDARTLAGAEADGLTGAAGKDILKSVGAVNATATASAESTAVAAHISAAREGMAAGAALSRSDTESGAMSNGLSGGDGADDIESAGPVEVHADAASTSTQVTADIEGAIKGVALGAALTESTTAAVSTAAGLAGGKGEDAVTNLDALTATSTSTVVSNSVSLQVSAAESGIGGGFALTDNQTTSRADTAGIDGAEDADTLSNHGHINLQSTAAAEALSVGVSLNGAVRGAAGGAAFAQSGALARSDNRGMDGGEDDDSLSNSGTIEADGRSTANAVSAAIQIGAAGTGLAGGAGIAESRSEAHARAVGMSGDAGNDTLTNAGDIRLMGAGKPDDAPDAEASAASVGVSLNGAVSGAGLGAALTDAGALAEARAVGLSGGVGVDTLTNEGRIAADLTSKAAAAGISVQVGVSGEGIAGGAALADSSATAIAGAKGVVGDEDIDKITNKGDIDLKSAARADALSVAVVLNGSMTGLAGGAALTDAGTFVDATAAGLDGGSGNDVIANTGAIDTTADATAESTSVSVSVGAAFMAAGVAVAEADSTAVASARGISGGAGDDRIINGDDAPPGTADDRGITADARVRSEGTSVAVSLQGMSMGVVANTSRSSVLGIGSGDGNDTVANREAIAASSRATAEGLSVTVALQGAALGNADTTAESAAAGIATGEGDDRVENDAVVAITGAATAASDAVSVGLIGSTDADASTTAILSAVGIDTGAGRDRVEHLGELTVQAGDPVAFDASPSPDCSQIFCGATAEAGAVSVTLAGYGAAKAASTSEADAVGIDGGDDHDVIDSRGNVSVSALSRGRSKTVNVGLLGGGRADAAGVTRSEAVGFEGGSGNDAIRNHAVLAALADARGRSKSFSFTGIGDAAADTTVTTQAQSTAIGGGEDRDEIENTADITSAAHATGTADSVSVNLIGQADSRADTTTRTDAVGIDGGDDDDGVANSARVTSNARSTATVHSASFTVAGVSSSEGLVSAVSNAVGIAGGQGADRLHNEGDVVADAATSATTRASSVSLLGQSQTGAGIRGRAVATGISAGGAEGGEITNRGDVESGAHTDATANGDSFSLAGEAAADAFITGEAVAAGIGGSEGADRIGNAGTIKASASVSAVSGQDAAVGLAGDAAANADITAMIEASGIFAGGGDDLIENSGRIEVVADVDAASKSDSQAGALDGDGRSGSAGAAKAVGRGIGFADGEDEMIHSGEMTVTVKAAMSAEGLADGSNFADGNGDAKADARAGATGYGLKDGAGAARIDNRGDITVDTCTRAHGYTNADGDGAFGDGDGNAVTMAGAAAETPLAAGIWLEDGDHRIDNTGTLSIASLAEATANAISDGDLVSSWAKSTASADMDLGVYGIRLGAGDSRIDSSGDIALDAVVNSGIYAKANPTGWADGNGDTDTRSASRVEGVGIEAGSGSHTVRHTGSLAVRAHTNPAASADNRDVYANGDGDSSDAVALNTTVSDAVAAGIRLGAADGMLTNAGRIDVAAGADTAPETRASSDVGGEADVVTTTSAAAAADGLTVGGAGSRQTNTGHIGVLARTRITPATVAVTSGAAADARATGTESALSTAAGLSAASGENRFANSGDLTVEARAEANPNAIADTTQVNSDAVATTTLTVSATAAGISGAGGRNEVFNSGDLTVTVDADANQTVRAEATDGTDANADAVGYASADGEADGIRLGGGANRVVNQQTLRVTATVEADSDADAIGGLIDGDARATAESSARARSRGICMHPPPGETGASGGELIVNRGDIEVSATATARADTWAEEDAGGTSDEAARSRVHAAAEAVGIRTGSGDDRIENHGAITVSSSAGFDISAQTEDDDIETYGIDLAAGAVGIHSGAGDDEIWNAGAVLASAHTQSFFFWDMGIRSDIGIRTETGNDRVHLIDDSRVEGGIDLGAGDDLLTLAGRSTVAGPVNGGDDMDTLRIEDRGRFSLEGLHGIEKINVDQGVLQTTGNIRLPANGEFRAEIFNPADGRHGHGALAVEGQATLDGTAVVIARPRVFRDSEFFALLSAQHIEQAFAAVNLPPDSALVSFGHGYRHDGSGRDLFEVKVEVEPMDKMADNRLQRRLAGHLEDVAPRAGGELAEAIGNIQLMPESGDFDGAFAALSPDSYDNGTRAAFSGTQQYVRTIQQRLHSQRAALKSAAAESEPGYGMWLRQFAQWGRQDSGDGFTGYDVDWTGWTIGMDKFFSDRLLLGLSFGLADADVDFDRDRGRSDLDTVTGSLYGSWFNDLYYLDGAFSYGTQDYDNLRRIEVGSLQETATSGHDGILFSGYLESGFNLAFDRWVLGPFASLLYLRIDEDGFTESGAGSLNLIVDDRQTDALLSDVGAVLAGLLRYERCEILPELRLAWRYDYGIDDRVVTSAFAGAPGSKFSVEGQDTARHGLVLEAGATLFHVNGVSVPIKYGAEFREDYAAHGIEASIRYEF